VVVHFVKTGARRYGVIVERDAGPALVANPAPGYDDFLPHDLLHFVAEAEWGIDGGVFGQLAAGGDPGIFIPVDERHRIEWLRRRKLRRKERPRGRRSEALAGVLDAAWKVRAGKAPLPEQWPSQLAAARAEPERLAEVVASLDDLAARWSNLQVGGSLTLEWPRPETRGRRRAGGAQRTERRVARRARHTRLAR
jgi:hypothetical protein